MNLTYVTIVNVMPVCVYVGNVPFESIVPPYLSIHGLLDTTSNLVLFKSQTKYYSNLVLFKRQTKKEDKSNLFINISIKRRSRRNFPFKLRIDCGLMELRTDQSITTKSDGVVNIFHLYF